MQRVAIVTGGSRGIGAATARLLAEQGWNICISFNSNANAAQRVVADCIAKGVKAIAVQADVSGQDDVAALFKSADALGPIGALINNAGIVAPKVRVDEMTQERLQRVLSVNVTGPFMCAGEAIRRMSSTRGGSGGVIVNVSSIAARLGSAGEYVDYAASKGAIDTMTVGLANEVSREGIRVNAVRPGVIATEIHASNGDPGRAERVGGATPVGRAGEPEEVAAAIAWLCSDSASYVMGALLDVSGGR
jgi:NAD(P)-dependent dehydrogenase (short-subunit alcohol dehydrogenase family)